MASHSRCSWYESFFAFGRAASGCAAAGGLRAARRLAGAPLRAPPAGLQPLGEVGEALGAPVLAGEGEDLGRHAIEQETVVGDQDEGARELEQGLFEHVEGGDVEVVGGLVEHQDVGGEEHQPGEHGARLLAPRELAHRAAQPLGREQEAPCPGGHVEGAPLKLHVVGPAAAQGERLLQGGSGSRLSRFCSK